MKPSIFPVTEHSAKTSPQVLILWRGNENFSVILYAELNDPGKWDETMEVVMTEEKKGLPVWAWFGIGCAGLLVLVLVVVFALGFFAVRKVKEVAGDFENSSPEMVAARLMIKAQPDIEEVSEDEDAGTITIREKKSGKEITVNLKELSEGHFVFDTDEGHVEISAGEGNDGGVTISSEKGKMVLGKSESYPDWLPIPENLKARGQYMMDDEGGRKGALTLEGELDASKIEAFYEKKLKDDGFEVQKNSFSHEKQSMTVLQAENSEKGRTLTVTIVEDENGPAATVAYQEK